MLTSIGQGSVPGVSLGRRQKAGLDYVVVFLNVSEDLTKELS